MQQNGGPLETSDGTGEVNITGGQLQTGDDFETMGSVSYQHIFSSDAIGSLAGMVRDNSNDLYSNPLSWPVNATQHNDFKEIYFSGSTPFITADMNSRWASSRTIPSCTKTSAT